jgi:hypothetical protein
MLRSLRSLRVAPLIAVAVAVLAGPTAAQLPVQINATVVDANASDETASHRTGSGPSTAHTTDSTAPAHTPVRLPYLRFPQFPFP